MTTDNRTDMGIAKTATPLLGDLLNKWLKLAEKLREYTSKDDWEERARILVRQVDLFGTAYMLAVARHLDPVRADRAAAFLAEMWDAGDSLGEWVFEWREQVADGKPLSLFLDDAEEASAS